MGIRTISGATFGVAAFSAMIAFSAPLAAAQADPAATPPVMNPQEPTGREQVEQLRVEGCERPALALQDRTACAERMKAATTDAERAAIRTQYEGIAKGNRMEGDGVPTASPPPNPQPAAPVQSEPSPATYPMGASDSAWLFAVGGGAIILGAFLFYGVTRRRRGGAAAKMAQDRGTNAAYGRTERR